MTTDHRFLRRLDAPTYELEDGRIRVVDLFAGCGGMTLGVAEAALRAGVGVDVRLAVDVDEAALTVYSANFPKANAQRALVESFFDGDPGRGRTVVEQEVQSSVGEVDVLLGGPPCQGHSDLNNHSRRDDDRNGLYLLMARAAEVLQPRVVVIENVPTVVHDKRASVPTATQLLRSRGFSTADAIVHLQKIGVPQRRARHILVASLLPDLDAGEVLQVLVGAQVATRTVRWAIGDLEEVEATTGFDAPSTPSATNLERINWLFDNDRHDLPNELRPECHQAQHSYVSMYGRLQWDEPAQTITTGFGSMGQGRYVHPSRRRTLTPHEAARLQGFPDFFDFSGVLRRGAWAKMIGNAVPPKLTLEVGRVILPALISRATTSSP